MQADQFRSVLQTRPFRQFTVMTADGSTLTVKHPENVAITPSGRTVVFVDESSHTVVDMESITKFIVARSRRKTDERA